MTFTRFVAASAVVLAMAGTAIADDRDVIIQSCHENLRLPGGGCDCVADKAMTEFNEREFVFFMAVISNDRPGQTAAAQNLTVEEMTGIGTKMNEMPGACAG